MSTTTDLLTRGAFRLDAQLPRLGDLEAYYSGRSPLSYLSAKSREQLQRKVRGLTVNFPRLAVMSLAERLSVVGFRTGDEARPDPALWDIWNANEMTVASDTAHVELLAMGKCFVIVWADSNGQPTISVESARQVTVEHDPMTRRVTGAVKRFYVAEGSDRRAHAFVYEPHQVTVFRAKATAPQDATLPGGGFVPVEGWEQVGTERGASIPNPLGVVPVVPLVNRGRLLDVDGVSEMDDLLDLSDALNKVMLDALTTSEFLSQPRRWATGLEIQEDEDGNAINPFSNEGPERVMQSESPETKFGAFAAADLTGYKVLAETLTAQLAALAGLPPSYLGINTQNPASAEAIRASEATLVARAIQKQRWLSGPWAEVMRLALAVEQGRPVSAFTVSTLWKDPSTRTPAETADAVSKLVGAEILSKQAGLEAMGYPPEDVALITSQRQSEALSNVDLTALL